MHVCGVVHSGLKWIWTEYHHRLSWPCLDVDWAPLPLTMALCDAYRPPSLGPWVNLDWPPLQFDEALSGSGPTTNVVCQGEWFVVLIVLWVDTIFVANREIQMGDAGLQRGHGLHVNKMWSQGCGAYQSMVWRQ